MKLYEQVILHLAFPRKKTDYFFLSADVEKQRADAERQVSSNAIKTLLEMGLSIELVAQKLQLTVEEVLSISRD